MRYKELKFTLNGSSVTSLVAYVNSDFYVEGMEDNYNEVSRMADIIINVRDNTLEKCRYPIADLVKPFLLTKDNQ